MTSRVGPKGQVVIPKRFRDVLCLEPGDEVDFELDGDSVRMHGVRECVSLRGRLAGHPLVDALERDHRRERSR
jgi:AbrB family looped-hinge helix DNA binding protein